jgi:hypothetical protein
MNLAKVERDNLSGNLCGLCLYKIFTKLDAS